MTVSGSAAATSADRQANPTDDLATLIANGEIRGEPMPDLEKMGYYVIIATARATPTPKRIAPALRRAKRRTDSANLSRQCGSRSRLGARWAALAMKFPR